MEELRAPPEYLEGMEPIDWSVSHNIRRLREFIGEPVAAFAERCGVSRQTVYEWEAGERGVSGTTQKLFAYIAADVGFTEAKRRAMEAAEKKRSAK